MTDTAALTAGLRASDPLALQTFWRVFEPKVLPICIKILGNGPDATDAAVDLLVSFCARHVHHLSDHRAIYSYVRLMAVRQCLEIKKRRAKGAVLDFDVPDRDAPSAEMRAVLTQLSPRLTVCLDRLTEKARQALRLKFTEEQTNEDIGRLLGGSKQYIGRLIRQSLEALRACIEKGGTKALESKGGAMGTQIAPITVDTVAQLLTIRLRAASVDHETHLDALARILEGTADEEAERAANETMASCSTCRETLTTLLSIQADTSLSGTRNEKGRLVVRALAVAATVLLAFGLGVMLSTREALDRPTQGSLHIKGSDDELTVAVLRGSDRFILTPLDPVEAGDRLGLFYTSVNDGYLTVLSMDAARAVSVLYPVGALSSGAIDAGDAVSLVDGALAEDGAGCEWIVAVFSDAPLPVDAAVRAVSNAQEIESRCGLDVAVDGARSVRVLPILRRENE